MRRSRTLRWYRSMAAAAGLMTLTSAVALMLAVGVNRTDARDKGPIRHSGWDDRLVVSSFAARPQDQAARAIDLESRSPAELNADSLVDALIGGESESAGVQVADVASQSLEDQIKLKLSDALLARDPLASASFDVLPAGASSGTMVPEPGTLWLLGLAFPLLRRRCAANRES